MNLREWYSTEQGKKTAAENGIKVSESESVKKMTLKEFYESDDGQKAIRLQNTYSTSQETSVRDDKENGTAVTTDNANGTAVVPDNANGGATEKAPSLAELKRVTGGDTKVDFWDDPTLGGLVRYDETTIPGMSREDQAALRTSPVTAKLYEDMIQRQQTEEEKLQQTLLDAAYPNRAKKNKYYGEVSPWPYGPDINAPIMFPDMLDDEMKRVLGSGDNVGGSIIGVYYVDENAGKPLSPAKVNEKVADEAKSMQALNEAQNLMAELEEDLYNSELNDVEKAINSCYNGNDVDLVSYAREQAAALLNKLQSNGVREQRIASKEELEEIAFSDEAVLNPGFSEFDVSALGDADRYRVEHGRATADGHILIRDMTPYRGGVNSLNPPPLQFLTRNEAYVYNYWLKKDPQRAEQYMAAVSYDLNARNAQWLADRIAEIGEGAPIFSSLASVIYNTVSPLVQLATLPTRLVSAFMGVEYDHNNLFEIMSSVGGNLRRGVTQKVDNPVFTLAYNGVMSIADCFATRFMVRGITGASAGSKVVRRGTMGMLGVQSGTASFRDAKNKGASDGQSYVIGIASGVFEAFFEGRVLTKWDDAMSPAHLTAIFGGDPGKIFPLLMKELSQQGGVNFSEEFLTELSNKMVDALVLGEKSDYAILKKRLIEEEGYTGEEACAEAFYRVFLEEPGAAGISGAIGGTAATTVNLAGNAPMYINDYLEARRESQAEAEVEKIPEVSTPGAQAESVKPSVKWQGEADESGISLEKEYVSLEDFKNSDSSFWRNVEYSDETTQNNIMNQTHDEMVAENAVVKVPDHVMDTVEESFPNLQGMKKKDRLPIIKEAINKLKASLRGFLGGFKNSSFEFKVNGKVLEAKLYNTGINEVLEKITKDKANMLYSTGDIFRNARYLYSTPDYDGDPNIYRWNYFYTPVQIGEETVGVRIAVRDMASPQESQIYNWGIKKDTSLDGAGRGNNRSSGGVSSDVSDTIISQATSAVKSDGGVTRAAVETATPTADISTTSVAVGDTFKDAKTGNTITVVERDGEKTTVTIDTGKKVETRSFTNSQADNLATNEQFEKIGSGKYGGVQNKNDSKLGENKPSGYVGTYSGHAYTAEQERLMASLTNDQLTNAIVSNAGATPNVLGIAGTPLWAELESAGLVDDGVLIDAFVVDERQRRFEAEKAARIADTHGENVASQYHNQHVLMSQFGLTFDEQYAIMDYKSSGSYVLNARMRLGIPLSAEQQQLIEFVANGLKKLPIYDGVVFRNIGFFDEAEFNAFVAEHSNKNTISYRQFTSASKSQDGYVVDSDYTVSYIIKSSTARDAENIGIVEEREVIFLPDTEFAISDVEISGNHVTIKMEEYSNGISKAEHDGENTKYDGRSDKSETFPRQREEVFSGTSVVRGGMYPNSEFSQPQSGSNSGTSYVGSGENNIRYDKETRNDSDAERPALSDIIEEKGTAEQADADSIYRKEAESNEKVAVQDSRRGAQGVFETARGRQSQDGNRSRVQERAGEGDGALGEAPVSMGVRPGEQEGLTAFSEEDIITASKDTQEHDVQFTLKNEYGIPAYVIKKSAWQRKAPASSNGGVVYIREGIDAGSNRDVAGHEATHVMAQVKYAPYLDFLERTSSMIDMSLEATRDILRIMEHHCEEDLLYDGDENNLSVYDELNATMYEIGVAEGIDKSSLSDTAQIFYDFDAYISELQAIHEQFKRDNTGGVNDTTENTTTSGVTAVNKDIVSTIENTLRPEIASTPEFMDALADRFGGDWIESLSKAIAEQYEKDGTIGDFEKLFSDGGKGVYNALTGNAAANLRYSVNENFAENYDSWVKRGRPNREVLSVGTTSEALKSIGVKNQKITWDTSKINKSLKKHLHLSDSIMEQVPDVLEKPIIVMQSKQSDSRITMFGELNDENGKPVLVVLELDARSRNNIQLNEIKVASTYGKDNAQSLINLSDILYVDPNKKRTDNWLMLNRLQLPLSITTYGPIKSITYPEGNVNTYSMQITNDYSREDAASEQAGNGLLSGSSGRDLDASTGEQDRRVSAYKQSLEGKTKTERKGYAKRLLEKGLTEEKIDTINSNGKKITHKYTLIKPEGYNDDMRSIVAEAEAKGKKVGFFVGFALRQFDGQRNFLIDGIKVSDTEMLLRYDGEYSPQSLLKHEDVHTEWNTPEMQSTKDAILDGISDAEKKKLLSDGRYKDYLELYENNEDAVWQEFVADVFACMNDYIADFIDIVANYGYNAEAIDRYSPREYNNIIDAGGNNAVLDDVGFGDVYELSTRQSLAYALKGQYWYPDLSRQKLEILKRKIRRDIETSTNAVTDTANWLFTNIDGTDVFAIYSTVDSDNPTLLYESKGDRAQFEKEYLLNLLKEYEDAENSHGQPNDVAPVLSGDWLQQRDSVQNSNRLVERRRGDRDAGILQRPSSRKPSKALGSVLENLFEVQGTDRSSSGGVAGDSSQSGVKYALSTSESDTAGLTSEDNKREVRYSISSDISDAEFWQSWLDKVKEFDAISKGENPARDINVPRKISEDRVVSRFARTLLEAGITPEENVSDFEKAILDGEMTYEVVTNKKAKEKALDRIRTLGFQEALRDWEGTARQGRISKEDFALGMELYNQCIANKDVRNAMKIAAELASEATRAGQTVQACRMLKLMTPDGQLYYLEKSIQKMNEEFKDKLGDKYKDIVLDEELMTDFLSETDEKKRNIAYDKLCQNIADQMPATLRDKWNSWRYLAMLGNPRTHLRNIVGNAVFLPAVRIKNYVGAVIEHIAGLESAKRTKSIRKTKEAVEFAKNDFEVMAKTLQGENAKYAVTSDIEGKRTIFKLKWLEFLRRKNFDFLEAEDMWFLKAHYVDALARLITVRNIDINSVTPQVLEAIRAIAVKEAQAATYRDANSIADGLNRLQKKLEHSDNKALRASSVLVEGVMPFKKTPMNIAKQGINYSPIGILKGIYTAATKLKSGDATAADVIDDFSKGLTGTAIMLLGYFLASLGFIVGAEDKSKKEKEFDKMVGEQSYALKVGDVFTYTLDWMTPSNLPLFIGVKLHDLTKDDFSFADIVDALSTVAEPLLELSVFSGVNDVIETAQYSDSEAVIAIGTEMATSYVLQALPTIGGQLSRMIDKNKREYYYVDKNSNIPKGVQNFIGQAASKIPFASYLFEPAIDEWGREETYGGIVERVFENTVSPGYYANDNYTWVDRELKKLYERTGESSVLPVNQQKYYKQDGIYYYMSAEDYTEVKRMRGQLSFKYISELLNSARYSSMSDEEKVKAIKKCYDRAGAETKAAMLERVKRGSK